MPSERATAIPSLAARFLYWEKPRAHMHTGGVALLDGPIDEADLRGKVARRLATRSAFRRVPDSATLNLRHPRFREVSDFDLDAHVVAHDLGPDAGKADLAERIGAIYSTPLERTRPLWEVHVVNGLAGERAAVVTKIHRALAPDLGATEVAETLFDHGRLPREEARPAEPGEGARTGSWTDVIFDRANAAVASLTRYAHHALEASEALTSERTLVAGQSLFDAMPDLALPVRRFPFNRGGSRLRALVGTRFSFAEARAIRRAAGGTIPDIVLTIVAGAISRYGREHGEPVRGRSLRVALPVKVREHTGYRREETRESFVPVNLPLDIEDPLKRLRTIRTTTRIMKAARVPELIAQVISLTGAVPPALQASFGALASDSFPLFNMLCAYVSGPQIPLYLQGHAVTSYYPFVPVGYGQGLACAVYNYRQMLHFGLTADRTACPDVARIRDLIDDEIRILKTAAGAEDIPPIDTSVAGSRQRAAALVD